MKEKMLCENLGVPLVKSNRNPIKITFSNIDDPNEKLEFPSINNAAKTIGKNPSCISLYIKKKTIITFECKEYFVSTSLEILRKEKECEDQKEKEYEILQKEKEYEKMLHLEELDEKRRLRSLKKRKKKC